MIKNVIIAGVGGQGTIFAGKILGTMAYQTGQHVKISEIHGMSQRGGSVVTQVRFGKHVYAPLAQAGEVDVLIALEELEALRYASYLKENGILLMCNCRIEPTASDGGIYPQSIRTQLEQKYYVYYMEEIPLRDKTLNVRMVGAAAGCLGFSREDGIKALEQNVAAEFLEKDKKAFLEGWEFYEQTQKSPAEWRPAMKSQP